MDPEWGERCRTLWERGRAGWPAFDISLGDFAAQGVSRPDPAKVLHPEDLYLCCACARAIPEALAALDRLLAEVPIWIRRVSSASDLAHEVRQHLLERLIVQGDERKRISQYSGSGPLRAWLRIAAVRTALNLKRNADERAMTRAAPEELTLRALSEEPELALVRFQHQETFRTALRDAFLALPREQRTVLRLHYAAGLSGKQMAQALHVQRTTVVRRLTRARTQMLQDTRRLVTERLRLLSTEVDSLIAVLCENLELSMTRLLRTCEAEEPPG
jgi:RNA polymerase sigma-70 factor (ECF subfamily)